jgi:hypothetical protein
MCGVRRDLYGPLMTATHLLITATPKPGRALDLVSGTFHGAGVCAPHAASVSCWRTAIGGPRTGQTHLSLSWDSAAAMGRALADIQADPAYAEHVALYHHGDVAYTGPVAQMAGIDLPGFPGVGPAATPGRPRILAGVLYPHTDQVLEFLPEAYAFAADAGRAWYARLWTLGIEGASSRIAVYNGYDSLEAMGTQLDQNIADPTARAIIAKARPLIAGRFVLQELIA